MADEQNARPPELQRKIAAIIAAIGLAYGASATRNQELLVDHWPDLEESVLDIARWVAMEFSVDPDSLDTDSVLGRLRAAILSYLDEHRDLTGDEARQYAELVIAAELRNAEIDLVQQAARLGGVDRIERRLGFSKSGPCQRCVDLAGEHPVGFPDLYWEHPNGVCSWHPVKGGQVSGFANKLASAVFAGRGNRGNPQALRDWYDDAARSHINWGHPGDFDRCVAIAGKYVKDPQGYCNLRHQDATGAPPGHAPGEERNSAHHAKRLKASVVFEHPAKGPHHCSECKHYESPGSCELVAGAIEPGDRCNLFEAGVVKMANDIARLVHRAVFGTGH